MRRVLLLELGRLYELRGNIQLACAAASEEDSSSSSTATASSTSTVVGVVDFPVSVRPRTPRSAALLQRLIGALADAAAGTRMGHNHHHHHHHHHRPKDNEERKADDEGNTKRNSDEKEEKEKEEEARKARAARARAARRRHFRRYATAADLRADGQRWLRRGWECHTAAQEPPCALCLEG